MVTDTYKYDETEIRIHIYVWRLLAPPVGLWGPVGTRVQGSMGPSKRFARDRSQNTRVAFGLRVDFIRLARDQHQNVSFAFRRRAKFYAFGSGPESKRKCFWLLLARAHPLGIEPREGPYHWGGRPLTADRDTYIHIAGNIAGYTAI